MSALSDIYEPLVLDKLLNVEDFTSPASWIALYTAQPGDGDTGIEVTGGSYARQQVFEATSASTPRWNLAAVSGDEFVVDNAQAITFPQATGNWGTITSFAVRTASVAGNIVMWGPLASAPMYFVGVGADDFIYSQAHGRSNDNKVVFQTIDFPGTLPAGLSEETEYFVVASATDRFQVSLTQGGAAVNLTADGKGIVFLSSYKVVNTNDTFSFPTGNLDLLIG